MQTTWLLVFAVASHSDAVSRSLTKRQSSEENAKIGNDKFFLVANGSHLLEVHLELNSVRALQFTGSGVSSIHVNANTSEIFICNDRTNEIWRTGVGVGDPTTLIVQKTGKENKNRDKLKLEACAVDWTAQQLYWINGHGKAKLVRSDFSGSTDTLIDEHADYKKVRSMVVDRSIADQTVLYFAGDKTVGDVKIPQSGEVQRTNDFIGNDDNDNEKDSPLSVALDDSTRKLYWIDGNDDYVNVYDLEAKTSATVAGAGTPVAVAVGQSTVAIIDSSSIRTADTRNTSSRFVRRVVSGLGTGLTAIAACSKTELHATLSPSTSAPSTQTWSTNLSDGTKTPLPNQSATTLVPTQGSSLEPSDGPLTTQTAHMTTDGSSTTQPSTDSSSTTQTAHTTTDRSSTTEWAHVTTDGSSTTQPSTDSSSTTQTAHTTTDRSSTTQWAHVTTDGSSTTQPSTDRSSTTQWAHATRKMSDRVSGAQSIPTDRSHTGTETKVDLNKSGSSGLSFYYYIGIGIAVPIVVVAFIIVAVVVRRKTRSKAGFHSSTVLANRVTVAPARSTRRYVGTPGGDATVTYNGTSVTVASLEENLRDFSNDPVYEEIPEIGNSDYISFGNHQVDVSRSDSEATQKHSTAEKNDETPYYIDWTELNEQSGDLYLSPLDVKREKDQ